MLVRSLRGGVPLERVSSCTAEHKVLECLTELQAGSLLQSPASSSSSSSSSLTSSSNISDGGGSSGGSAPPAAVLHAMYVAPSSHAPQLTAWWGTAPSLDSSTSNSSSGFTSSSTFTSSSSSSSSSGDSSLELPVLPQGFQFDLPNRASGQQHQQALKPQMQQPQPCSAQGCQQEATASSAEPLASRSWAWGWRWPSCSSSTDSVKDCKDDTASSSSQASTTTAPTTGSAAVALEQRLGVTGFSSLWQEGSLAAAADSACLHPAVQAHLQGRLGVAFSGGGFRYTYFIGVMDVLHHKLGLTGPPAMLSGASSGSLIAVLTKCGLPVETVVELTRRFTHDCASHGVRGRLGLVLSSYLDAYLPENAHKLCDGTTFLATTRVWPTIRTRLVSSFKTRAELIKAVLASCHLPTLSDGSLAVRFKGRLHIDGGLLSVVTPPPEAAHTVLVCSMPSTQIARLPAFISRPQARDISISPDTFQPWPFTRAQTTALALQPPDPGFIHHMVERGRHDALAWAEAVGFTRNGHPLFPTAQQLAARRQQLFAPSWQCDPAGLRPQPAKAAVAAATATQPMPVLQGAAAGLGLVDVQVAAR